MVWMCLNLVCGNDPMARVIVNSPITKLYVTQCQQSQSVLSSKSLVVFVFMMTFILEMFNYPICKVTLMSNICLIIVNPRSD